LTLRDQTKTVFKWRDVLLHSTIVIAVIALGVAGETAKHCQVLKGVQNSIETILRQLHESIYCHGNPDLWLRISDGWKSCERSFGSIWKAIDPVQLYAGFGLLGYGIPGEGRVSLPFAHDRASPVQSCCVAMALGNRRDGVSHRRNQRGTMGQAGIRPEILDKGGTEGCSIWRCGARSVLGCLGCQGSPQSGSCHHPHRGGDRPISSPDVTFFGRKERNEESNKA